MAYVEHHYLMAGPATGEFLRPCRIKTDKQACSKQNEGVLRQTEVSEGQSESESGTRNGTEAEVLRSEPLVGSKDAKWIESIKKMN